MTCPRCRLDEPSLNTECFRDDGEWRCGRLDAGKTCDTLPEGTMAVVMPWPNKEYRIDAGLCYWSDDNAIIRNVPPEHFVVLGEHHKGIPTPRAIVLHSFPEGRMSVHCFACGGFIDMDDPPGKVAAGQGVSPRDPQVWLKDGRVIDFVNIHKTHAEDRVFNPPPAPPIHEVYQTDVKIEPAQHLLIAGGPPTENSIDAQLEPEVPDLPRAVVIVEGGPQPYHWTPENHPPEIESAPVPEWSSRIRKFFRRR